jgi:hypothetical protein
MEKIKLEKEIKETTVNLEDKLNALKNKFK